jgi:PhnB protein
MIAMAATSGAFEYVGSLSRRQPTLNKEMIMQVQPYLNFYGRCEEAIEFYKQALGAEVLFMLRSKDAPPEYAAQGELGERIMHVSFKVGDSVLMASDGRPDQAPEGYAGVTISISPDSVEQGEKIFNALANGGQVGFAWQPTFWAKGFGMVTDKFGVPWMVNVENPQH